MRVYVMFKNGLLGGGRDWPAPVGVLHAESTTN